MKQRRVDRTLENLQYNKKYEEIRSNHALVGQPPIKLVHRIKALIDYEQHLIQE